MKVILLQNVPKLGQKGEIKEVSEGHAVNFLIPRKMVTFATPEELNRLKAAETVKNQKTDRLHNKAHDLLSRLEGKQVVIKARANDKGHLFAQIHIKEIADAIGNLKIDISEDWINLKEPIKSTGEFPISIEAYGKKIKVILKVESLK